MDVSYRYKLKAQLDASGSISYKDILEILDAFQIASGQGFAIGKTKAILDFLKEGKLLVIENYEYLNINKRVSSITELVNMFKHIDQYVDLFVDKDFKEYFS